MLPTENLAKLISQKRQLLAQLLEIANGQQRLVEAGDVATLLKLLATKQKLLLAVQEVERRLAPHHEEDPEQRPWPTPEDRAACAAEAADCSRMLARIIEMEKSQEAIMTNRRDALAGQLKTAHQAHAAHSAYQAHQMPTNANTQAAS